MIKSEWLKNLRSSSRNRRLASRRSVQPAAIERLESRALLAAQVVTGSPSTQDIVPGTAVSIDVDYTTLDDFGNPADLGSTGLGIFLHFDSSQMTFDNLTNLYTVDFLQQAVQPDDTNADNDPNTDFVVNVAWFKFAGGATWGQGVQPLRVYTANFIMDPGFTGSTTLNFSYTTSPVGFTDFLSNSPVINEFITPDVSISNAADVTEGGNSLFDVVLSTNPSGVVTVFYDTIDGTATVADADFTQATGQSITFNPGGSLTQQISIPTTADNLVEPDEGFQVRLTSATNGNIIADTGSATILNDDVPTVSVNDAGSIAEGSNAVFTVSLDQAPLAPVTIDVSTVAGSATAADFTAVNQTLTFLPNGSLSQDVTVQTANDTQAELDETFQLVLGAVTGATVDPTANAGTATILANDEPSVSILNLGDAAEGQTSAFIVQISNDPAVALTVDYSTADGSAISGLDFTSLTGTLTFLPGGPLVQQINVQTTDDLLVEPSENFSVNLSNVANGSLNTAQAFGLILNTDLPAVTVSGGGLIAEGQVAEFTVTLDQAPISPVTVTFSTTDGTATAGSDFTAVSNQTLVFNPGGPLTQTIAVSTTDDTLSEIDESFDLTIDSVNGGTAAIGSATATILVNDDPVVSIQNVSVSEADGTGAITVTLDQSPARTFTVDYSTRNGTAIDGDDYTAVTGTITFDAGTMVLTQSISFPILQDTLVEVDENLFIDLFNPVNGTISDGEGEVTIASEDVPNVTVSTPATVAEGQDIVLEFVLDQVPVFGGFVMITTTDGTANSPDDYAGISAPMQVFFNAGDPLTRVVTIATVNDAVLENDETFTVNLSSASLLTISGPTSVTATITSEDVPSVSISDVSATEDNDIVITVSVSEAPLPGQDLTVELSTADGTATAGTDFTGISGQQLTFTSAGPLTQQVTVSVTDDTIVELDETFTARLSNVSNGTIATAQATATITDNDVPAVSVAEVSIVNEGDDVIFIVSLDQAPVADVLVTVSTMNGSAAATSDFAAISGQVLTFSPGGALTQAVTVSTVDDTVSEIDESFSLVIDQVSGGTVADGQGDASISGSDLPRISISDALDIDEAGQAVFVVSLDQAPASTLMIDFTTADGTAIAGSDYTAVSGTLTFNPGDPLTQEITVTLTDDTLVEATETFAVNLSNPASVVVSDGQGAGSIVSTDLPTVSIAGNVSSVAEGANAVFTVTLDQAPVVALTFDIATTDGTAVAGTDYTAVTQTVTFNPGDSLTRQITVSTTDDTTVEVSKTFLIDISNPSGVNVATSQATGTITSEDVPTISVIGTAAEEGEAVVFTISVDQMPLAGSDVTVDVAFSNGTASVGSDYTAVPSQTLTFTAADTSLLQTISVSTIEDRNVEVDETFFLDLTNPANSMLATAQATGTITNDDVAIPVDISVSVAEGTEVAGTVITITATSESAVLNNETVDVSLSGTNITSADASFSSTTISIPAGTTTGSVTLTILNDADFEGDETATVSLVNPTGNLQLGSVTANITIRDSEAPALDSTPRFSSSLRPVLTWQEAPAAAAYEIYFGRLVPGEERLFVSQSIVTTGSFQPPANLTAAVYRYWVRTIDTNGVGGTWSDSGTFEIRPLLVNPLTPTFTARPVFEWFPIPHADSYQIFVRTTTGDIIVDNITETRWTPTTDLAEGPIFWWIRASDRKGNLGWSARGETGTQTTVTAPVGTVAGATPTIQWLEAQGASRYILHVERISTRQVVIRENNITSTSFTTSTLASGTYRVWVKAIDASGDFNSGRWSRSLDFTIADANAANTDEDIFLTQLTVLPSQLLYPETEIVESVTAVAATQEPVTKADAPEQQASETVVKKWVGGTSAELATQTLDDLMSDPASLAGVFDHGMFGAFAEEK